MMDRFNKYMSFARRKPMSQPSILLHRPHINHFSQGQNHERKKSHFVQPLFVIVFIFSLSSWLSPVAARASECSNLNTSSDDPFIDPFQSHGLCYDHCMGNKFAFAVVQGNQCWCSNVAPGVKSTGCDENCPGYPLEQCGNTGKDLFGYLALPYKPSSTMNVDLPTETPSPTPSSNTNSTSSKPANPETTPGPSSSPTSSAALPSVTVFTTIGGFKTIVISEPTHVPVSSSIPQSSDNKPEENGYWNGGRVAGLTVGLLLLLLLIVAAILFVRRRRHQKLLSVSSLPGSVVIPAGGAGMFGRQRSRSLSTLGLIGEKGALSRETSPSATQNFPASSITTPPPVAGCQPPLGQVYDQRLDPEQVYLRFDPNTGSSRMSVRSLRDDQDYSRRVLRLANPDD